MILLGVIALVVIGPKQLPEVARSVARLLNELKRATGDLTETLMDVRDTAQRSVDEARDMVNPTKMMNDAVAKFGEEPKADKDPSKGEEHG